MKVIIRECDVYDSMIELDCDNIRTGHYLVRKCELFDIMEIIKSDIERTGESCEFIIID